MRHDQFPFRAGLDVRRENEGRGEMALDRTGQSHLVLDEAHEVHLLDVVDTFSERLVSARDEDDAQALMHETVQSLGFKGFGYVVCDPLAEVARVMSDYPADWIERYRRAKYSAVDPVVCRAARGSESFLWGEASSDPLGPMTAAQRDVMAEAREFGVVAGVATPVAKRQDSQGFGVVSLAFDPKHVRRRWLRVPLALPHLISQAFHAHMVRISGRHCVRPSLSQREAECLTWSARGKTRPEVAIILQISSRTVGFHIENAKAKLGAVNVTHAVALALRADLISI